MRATRRGSGPRREPIGGEGAWRWGRGRVRGSGEEQDRAASGDADRAYTVYDTFSTSSVVPVLAASRGRTQRPSSSRSRHAHPHLAPSYFLPRPPLRTPSTPPALTAPAPALDTMPASVPKAALYYSPQSIWASVRESLPPLLRAPKTVD